MTDGRARTDAPAQIRIPSIPDVVYATLRREIAQGVYPPGRISISRLAEHFGVSAMPVREALRRLEAEGLVSFNAGRQVVVNSLSFADLEEVFAIRLELEDLAVRTAVPNLRDDDVTLTRLEHLLDKMDAKKTDPDSWRRMNSEFHHTIYQASGMPRLQVTIDSLWVAIEPYLPVYVSEPDFFGVVQDQHRLILKEIRGGNARAAAKLLREHLKMTLERLRSSFEQANTLSGVNRLTDSAD